MFSPSSFVVVFVYSRVTLSFEFFWRRDDGQRNEKTKRERAETATLLPRTPTRNTCSEYIFLLPVTYHGRWYGYWYRVGAVPTF